MADDNDYDFFIGQPSMEGAIEIQREMTAHMAYLSNSYGFMNERDFFFPSNPYIQAERRQQENDMIIVAKPKKTDYDPIVLARVRSFIIRALNKDRGNPWPGDHCSIVVDGRRKYVCAGTSWQIYGDKCYVPPDHYQIFEWVPGALIAIAAEYGMEDDSEINTKAMDLLAESLCNAARPMQNAVIQTFGGQRLNRIAFNTRTKEYAAYYEDDSTWRMPNYEPVDVTEDGWHALEGSF